MKFELWSYNEYGDGSILKTSTNLDDVLKEARTYVTSANLDNALAMTEKDKQWEAYYPVVMKGSKVSKDTFYAGNKKNGQHNVWVKKGEKFALEPLPKNTVVRFVLGDIVRSNSRGQEKTTETWWLTDHKGNVVEGLGNQLLDQKTQVFIKVVQ